MLLVPAHDAAIHEMTRQRWIRLVRPLLLVIDLVSDIARLDGECAIRNRRYAISVIIFTESALDFSFRRCDGVAIIFNIRLRVAAIRCDGDIFDEILIPIHDACAISECKGSVERFVVSVAVSLCGVVNVKFAAQFSLCDFERAVFDFGHIIIFRIATKCR